ncbi:DNA primase [Streptomyces sp. ID05-04B]|uniref:DNA primase n=1 Tax=unclassified Streptomyces TaxID=2593676 RepID=UPI000D1B4DB6|nr:MULTISPECIES: DNA primase [unclassified Streptomyces]AVV45504.1 DNA primase [Streptomyces sp. P3]MDX5565844.1 DNA primase [Streptomyces sp. ID05-04B]
MNRTGMGLAIGAGYLLGRTRKLKLALAVGSLVAGKKLNLTPRGIADLVSQQLLANPQFKEIGDQLRTDLRGVGKAASGAMVERQMDALADRLHGRTAEVRDQIEGVVPGKGADDEADEEYDEPQDAHEDQDDEEDGRDTAEDDGGGDTAEDTAEEDEEEAPRRRTAARKAPAKKSAKKAPARKAPARTPAAKKTASAGKSGARTAAKTASGTTSRSRRPKGGGDR